MKPRPNSVTPTPAALQLADRWILSRLARVNRETADRYSNYGLGEAAKGLYEFAWNDVCDWYLELSKRRLNPGENPSAEALADQRVAQAGVGQGDQPDAPDAASADAPPH